MYLCLKLHLKVDEALAEVLLKYERGFKSETERICSLFEKRGYPFEYAYRFFSKSISYNSKHLVLSCARDMYHKKSKGTVFKYDFSSYWSNSSYCITDDYLKIELGPDKYRDKQLIPFYFSAHTAERLHSGKPMNMKIVKRKQNWFALIYVEYELNYQKSEKCMGVDIGIKVPAVCAIEPNSIRYFGNGREIRFVQRKYRAHIIAMQKGKQYAKLVKFEHKLNHILNDYDHKISKQIIDFALQHNVGIIKLENLTAINKKFKTSKNPNIYLWSYRRLQEYITYKANLNGIKVRFINPYQTSQMCPVCKALNHAKDRRYSCKCGYHNHRDAVAAINIMNAL